MLYEKLSYFCYVISSSSTNAHAITRPVSEQLFRTLHGQFFYLLGFLLAANYLQKHFEPKKGEKETYRQQLY